MKREIIEQYLTYCKIIYPEANDWIYSVLSNYIYKQFNQLDDYYQVLNKEHRNYYEQCIIFIIQYKKKKSIKRISVEHAFVGFTKLKSSFKNKKTSRDKIHVHSNSYYWTQLIKKEDFYRESSLLSNCLASKINDINKEYYSLSDKDGNPLLVISVENNILIESKEFNNQEVGERNRVYLKSFLKKKKIESRFRLNLFEKICNKIENYLITTGVIDV